MHTSLKILVGSSLVLMLSTPLLTSAVDADTARLEAYALCHAQPYRCAPGALMTPAERAQDGLCDRLTPHRALIASKIIHREPLDSADLAAQQTWETQRCRDWELTRAQRQPQSSPPPAAVVVPSVPRPLVDCVTTWSSGLYSSRLTTTCISD